MKLTIALIFCSLAVAVLAEQCGLLGDISRCSHVTCDAGHSLECHNGYCTCSDHDLSCVGNTDCHGDCSRGWHCVDKVCRCGYGIGLPGGIGGIIDGILGGIGKKR